MHCKTIENITRVKCNNYQRNLLRNNLLHHWFKLVQSNIPKYQQFTSQSRQHSVTVSKWSFAFSVMSHFALSMSTLRTHRDELLVCGHLTENTLCDIPDDIINIFTKWRFSKKRHSNGGFFVYQISIDGIDPSWASLDAEFEGEYAWPFVLKYPL